MKSYSSVTNKVRLIAFFMAIILAATLRSHAQAPPTLEVWCLQHRVIDTIPGLRAALKNPDPEVRSVVAGALAIDKDLGAIPLIRAALQKEPVESVRTQMAAALAQLKDWQGSTLLIKTCNERDAAPTARLEAANRLLDLGGNECLPAVVGIMEEDPDPPSRQLGMQYLRRITSVPQALCARLRAVLIKELQDIIPINRVYASECLSIFGDQDSIDPLENAIANEKDPTTRMHLKENLERLKSHLR